MGLSTPESMSVMRSGSSRRRRSCSRVFELATCAPGHSAECLGGTITTLARNVLNAIPYGLVMTPVLLSGCDDGDGYRPVPPPLALQAGEESGHGHFRGTVKIGEDWHHAEAIITIDGYFRLYVGGEVDGSFLSGAGPSDDMLNPDASMQLFGQLDLNGGQGMGSGLIVGEICPVANPGRFCGDPVEAQISVEEANGEFRGEIRIQLEGSQETWTLEIGEYSAWYKLCPGCGISGLFEEKLASFAHGAQVIISIDDGGRLFFQDPASGCTGNATLTQHGDYFVFDVSLSIANCNAEYSYLNSDAYVGLATKTQSGYWDYDDWLVIIAATPDGSASHAAVTMLAEYHY